MTSRVVLRMLRRFGGFGAVGVGVTAVSIGATVWAMKVSADGKGTSCPSCPNPKKPFLGQHGAQCPAVNKWDFNWDGLEPGVGGYVWSEKSTARDDGCDCDSAKPGEEPSAKARRHILLIRHGQYNNDGTENDDVHTLTDLGQAQAALTGKKLGNLGVKLASITSSDMIRAKQTACIILNNMDCQEHLKLDVKDPLLNEGYPCVPEPPYKRLDIWNPSQREILVEGGRIETAFRKYFHRADPSQEEDSWEVIVCHGNVIRYFALRALQFPPEGWMRIAIDHCSITRLTILPSGEVVLRCFGDSGHIPREKATV